MTTGRTAINGTGGQARRVGVLWLFTLVLVVASVAIGKRYIKPGTPFPPHDSLLHRMAWVWDGGWYSRIVSDGYTYSAAAHSSIVFFPAYPLAARWLRAATGVPQEVALLLVSNACLLGAMLTFAAYARDRQRADGPGDRLVTEYAVFAMALLPTAFFFRVAYTESLLLLMLVLVMYGMRRNWPTLFLALLIGVATATRSVGVALLAPFAWHLFNRAGRPNPTGASTARRLARLPLLLVGCWGLLAFMAFQYHTFHDPLAFAKAQAAWHVRPPAPTLLARAGSLLTVEPVRAAYTPGSSCYWARRSPRNLPPLNMFFMNPVFFLGTVGLVAVGVWRGWVNGPEALLSALLLFIPYVLQGDRQGMTSMGRFSAVVFPVYLVLGQLLAKLPRWAAIAVLIGSASVMGIYVAIFSAGLPMY